MSSPGATPTVTEGSATGIGSWPGTDQPEALAAVRDVLPDLPHLPELPARGPGADLVGRGAALLVSLPVDLQPHGWRLVDHPGREARRAASFLRSDLDDLAEAFDGYSGPFKIQVAGPYTLAGWLWLARGERALTDPGARREVVSSLAAGVVEHLAAVRAAVPGAEVVVQLDEPSLPAVLAGRLPTASGYGLVRAVDRLEAQQGLTEVLAAIGEARASTVVHCCAADVPVELLWRAGAGAVSLDLSLLGEAAWEAVAGGVEAGRALWAGLGLGGSDEQAPVTGLVDAVRQPWRQVGLPLEGLAAVVVTPPCGLPGRSPDQARRALTRAVAVGRALADTAHG